MCVEITRLGLAKNRTAFAAFLWSSFRLGVAQEDDYLPSFGRRHSSFEGRSLRRFTRFEIQDEAIWKVAELMAYAMFLNLFLHGAEAFKEFYSDTQHLLYTRYWFLGLGQHRTLVPYAWAAVGLNVLAFGLFIIPGARRHWVTLNLGCLATYAGCYIDKGMGLIIPGLTPDALGEIYEYYPTLTELRVAAGVFALGFLVFTLIVRLTVQKHNNIGILLQELLKGIHLTAEAANSRSLKMRTGSIAPGQKWPEAR
jgi:hypothetical protein